jgi:hypothetical protein
MAAFFLSIALFLLAWIVHVAIWHVKRPRATGQALILIMIASILAAVAILRIAAVVAPGIGFLLPPTIAEWAQAILAALGFAAAYVLSYPAIEVPSPTLVIITLIAGAEPQGLRPVELYQRLDDAFLVTPRIEDLLHEGLARETEGQIFLTPKGIRLARLFSAWRRLLGAGLGG